ncbi:MAG: adenylate kinase [Planctomycetota bacterium]|jgi:adenylate kinase
MKIVLLGAPGAGKGTQCQRIIERFELVHLSSGDILRQERSAGSELGKKAESHMDSGGLVPDELIVKMMVEAMSKAGLNGFVLDGFPRTVNQAAELDKALSSSGTKIDVVLNLNVDDGVAAARITGRRICPECGAIYHIMNLKPKVFGRCDVDGAELVQRADDVLEVVMNRLKHYHGQTKAVVDYYKATPGSPGVCDIDATRDADEVSALIFEKLESLASADK